MFPGVLSGASFLYMFKSSFSSFRKCNAAAKEISFGVLCRFPLGPISNVSSSFHGRVSGRIDRSCVIILGLMNTGDVDIYERDFLGPLRIVLSGVEFVVSIEVVGGSAELVESDIDLGECGDVSIAPVNLRAGSFLVLRLVVHGSKAIVPCMDANILGLSGISVLEAGVSPFRIFAYRAAASSMFFLFFVCAFWREFYPLGLYVFACLSLFIAGVILMRFFFLRQRHGDTRWMGSGTEEFAMAPWL